jgi:quercetin dioxygenase-like cupin family protein
VHSVVEDSQKYNSAVGEASQMKTKTKLFIGAAAIVAGAGLALATPIVGLVSPLLSVGTQNADLQARGAARTASGERFRVELETEGPSTLSTQAASIAAGGHNGWHSHPGMVVVTVISGSITWYDENCVATDYKAGDSWVEGSQIHAFRVTSSTAVQLMAWFVTAQGQALRTDQPAPACAAGLGL